jgi:hypothetical protein
MRSVPCLNFNEKLTISLVDFFNSGVEFDSLLDFDCESLEGSVVVEFGKGLYFVLE